MASLRKLTAVGWIVLLSCSESDGGGKGAPKHTAQLVNKLRDCGVISSQGDFHPGGFLSSDEWVAACFRDCYIDAPCEALQVGWCTDDSDDTPNEATIGECFDACNERANERSPNGFQCADGTRAWRCDGEEGCSDGADEEDCTDFVCADGERIPQAFKCDDWSDCADDSDETGCPGYQKFSCESGTTTNYVTECDGYEDCSDGSDERDCVARGLLHQCADGELVDTGAPCDRFADCGDGSDEVGCAELICP